MSTEVHTDACPVGFVSSLSEAIDIIKEICPQQPDDPTESEETSQNTGGEPTNEPPTRDTGENPTGEGNNDDNDKDNGPAEKRNPDLPIGIALGGLGLGGLGALGALGGACGLCSCCQCCQCCQGCSQCSGASRRRRIKINFNSKKDPEGSYFPAYISSSSSDESDTDLV